MTRGPSACGKSSLLRMIAGLEAISARMIEIGGVVVSTPEPRERGRAMVFQNYARYWHMKVAKTIGCALNVARALKPERHARVAATLASAGLGDLLDRLPVGLSGGQGKRVAMARANIQEPKVHSARRAPFEPGREAAGPDATRDPPDPQPD